MGYNGSGVFSNIYSWVAQRNSGFDIDSTQMDAQDSGIASGLSNCICRDGQSTIIANIGFNGNRIINLADPVSSQDAVTSAYLATEIATVESTVQAAVLAAVQAMLIGIPLPFAGATAPSGFVFCYGQTLSQTTCPLLYAALGTTWGPASGGTFTLPDFRGRVLAGADNMGGSAAGRLTGFALAVVGGAQTVTLAATQIPAHTHNYSGTTGTDNPDHEHTFPYQNQSSASGGNAFNSVAGGTSGNVTTSGATARHQHAYSGTTDNGTGGGASHNNIQPTAAINYMLLAA